mgnify:CR=1 FL=1|tara:strand:+ start:446 stop:757 length:312 start_codon:yes stop_codon:yes gene_type:complete
MTRHYIRLWRKSRGLTQKQLAERMEREPGEQLMSYVTVSNIERGDQSPTLEQLTAFAEALEVSVPDLLENDPTKNGDVVDLLRLINDDNRATVVAMIKAAIGK